MADGYSKDDCKDALDKAAKALNECRIFMANHHPQKQIDGSDFISLEARVPYKLALAAQTECEMTIRELSL